MLKHVVGHFRDIVSCFSSQGAPTRVFKDTQPARAFFLSPARTCSCLKYYYNLRYRVYIISFPITGLPGAAEQVNSVCSEEVHAWNATPDPLLHALLICSNYLVYKSWSWVICRLAVTGTARETLTGKITALYAKFLHACSLIDWVIATVSFDNVHV